MKPYTSHSFVLHATLGIPLLLHCLHAEAVINPKPRFWVYSLVGTDYNGHRMLPYFLQHYEGLGVARDSFHFDLLHDPAEPNDGLKVSKQTFP